MNQTIKPRWVHPAPLSWQHSHHHHPAISFLFHSTVTVLSGIKLMNLDIRAKLIYIMLTRQTIASQRFAQFRQHITQGTPHTFPKLSTKIFSSHSSDIFATSFIGYSQYFTGFPYTKPDLSTLEHSNPLLFHSAQFLICKERNDTNRSVSTGQPYPVRYHYQTKTV